MTDLDKSLGDGFARTPEDMATLVAAGVAAARRMLAFIDASPTPHHAVATAVARLAAVGFLPLAEEDAWTLLPGDRRFVVRDTSTLVAFVVGERSPALAGFRIVGAHTDSPNLRIKPNPDLVRSGYLQLGVEPYGGVLLTTWLDRDLSIAGRVLVDEGNGRVGSRLVDLRRPVARVPNLAIHLDRKVNTDGLLLNQQRHMVPVLGTGSRIDLAGELAVALELKKERILGHDLSLYDTQPGALGGLHDELVYSARLDNLASSFAAVEALASLPPGGAASSVIALYDHEECGSRSAVGAAGSVLHDVLSRITECHSEGQAQAFARAMAQSLLVSADMAHAVHPNYSDRHDPEHAPQLNRGLVIKSNVNQSYATTGVTRARFTETCRQVGFAPQSFVVRSDLPCGSTIGPIASAQLGLKTVDVGAPMLSMHSCRELCGSLDVHLAVETYRIALVS